MIERDNFPTDRYLAESLRGRSASLEIRWIEEAGSDGVRSITSFACSTRSGLPHPLPGRLSLLCDHRHGCADGAAHDAGALTLWDLCHSVGSIPIDLHRDDVDIAVGCTYKYLNGGPGSPAFTYVRRDLQPRLSQPIWGWWGRADMFDMAQGYQP